MKQKIKLEFQKWFIVPKYEKKLKNLDNKLKDREHDLTKIQAKMYTYKNRCKKNRTTISDKNFQIEFLTKRDNSLQEIEQIFMKEPIDIEKLSKLVKRTK